MTSDREKALALMPLRQLAPARAADETPLEWLVANGLGGYASGHVDGPPLRRFHGLLVAAHPAPAGRVMLLHHLEDALLLEGEAPVPLRPGRGEGPTTALTDFALEAGLPHWRFTQGEMQIEQTVFMPHEQNTVHVRYRLTGAARQVRLSLRPWLDFRPHEGKLAPRQAHVYTTTPCGPAACECVRADMPATLWMRVSGTGASFSAEAADWHDVPYAIERDRGYECTGAMHAPGAFEVTLRTGEEVFLTASTDTWAQLDALAPAEAWTIETARRERLVAASDVALQTAETFLLPLAADQFLVRPATRDEDETAVRAAGGAARTIIAGYPWFTDWGRDTMISLEGLTLVTGRATDARDVLRTFAHHEHQAHESFNARFWNADAGHLFDLVDGEDGDDAACRPNQVIAVAVTHSPLARERWAPVADAVAAALLTPVGLRTLSRTHPDYQPRYVGDLHARDAAYHQGTVWPWLLGPFLDAWLAVRPDDGEGARELLAPLLEHLLEGGSVGSVSEVFDAEPPFVQRGCIAQAWSVAELARGLVKISRATRQ